MRMGVAMMAALIGVAAGASAREPQVVRLSLTSEGFAPAAVHVKKGQPVQLVITRVTDATCAKRIVVPSYGLEADLPLNMPVTLSFTPAKDGEVRYGCAMGQMVSGVLIVDG